MEKIGIVINDIHLGSDNIEQVLDLISQAVKYCNKEEIKTIYIAGDVVHSRSSLRMDVLQALLEMRSIILQNNINLCALPGNHDRTRYDSPESWLDVWIDKNGSELDGGSMLAREYKRIIHGDVAIHILPYFKEDMLIPMIDDINSVDGKINILISHFAMNGSVNNNGSKVSNGISAAMLKKFDFVYLGHYHNMHKPAKNVWHLPSLCQNNFGEDDNKGFTVLFDDGTHEIINTVFKRFENVKVDLDKLTPAKLNKLIKQYANSEDSIKFKLSGSEEKVRAFKKDKLEDVGIKCEKLYAEADVSDEEVVDITETSLRQNNDQIIESFGKFCEKKELDYEKGIEFLKNDRIYQRQVSSTFGKRGS